jgi:hypothetical protein
MFSLFFPPTFVPESTRAPVATTPAQAIRLEIVAHHPRTMFNPLIVTVNRSFVPNFVETKRFVHRKTTAGH